MSSGPIDLMEAVGSITPGVTIPLTPRPLGAFSNFSLLMDFDPGAGNTWTVTALYQPGGANSYTVASKAGITGAGGWQHITLSAEMLTANAAIPMPTHLNFTRTAGTGNGTLAKAIIVRV